jgi:hypothetical protein
MASLKMKKSLSSPCRSRISICLITLIIFMATGLSSCPANAETANSSVLSDLAKKRAATVETRKALGQLREGMWKKFHRMAKKLVGDISSTQEATRAMVKDQVTAFVKESLGAVKKLEKAVSLLNETERAKGFYDSPTEAILGEVIGLVPGLDQGLKAFELMGHYADTISYFQRHTDLVKMEIELDSRYALTSKAYESLTQRLADIDKAAVKIMPKEFEKWARAVILLPDSIDMSFGSETLQKMPDNAFNKSSKQLNELLKNIRTVFVQSVHQGSGSPGQYSSAGNKLLKLTENYAQDRYELVGLLGKTRKELHRAENFLYDDAIGGEKTPNGKTWREVHSKDEQELDDIRKVHKNTTGKISDFSHLKVASQYADLFKGGDSPKKQITTVTDVYNRWKKFSINKKSNREFKEEDSKRVIETVTISVDRLNNRDNFNLAADDLTAAVLGLPQSASYKAIVSGFLYGPKQGEQNGMKFTYNDRIKSFSSSEPGDADISIKGEGLFLSDSISTVFGNAPGSAAIVASVAKAALKWKREPVRNWSKQLSDAGVSSPNHRVIDKSGPITATTKSISIHKITDIIVKPSRDKRDELWIRDGKGESVDFEVTLLVEGPQGTHPRRLNFNKAKKFIVWELKGNNTSFTQQNKTRRNSSWFKRITPVEPGKAELSVGLSNGKGKIFFTKTFQLASGRIDGTLTIEELPNPPISIGDPKTPSVTKWLELGSSSEYIARITGASNIDMSNYEVRWKVLGGTTAKVNPEEWLNFEPTTPLKRDGDDWLSNCPFSLKKSGVEKHNERKDGYGRRLGRFDAVFQLVASVHKKEEDRPLGMLENKDTKILGTHKWFRINRVKLGLLGTGTTGFISVTSMDIFFPPPSGNTSLGRFGWALYHSKGLITQPLSRGQLVSEGVAKTALKHDIHSEVPSMHLKYSNRLFNHNLTSAGLGVGSVTGTYAGSEALGLGYLMKLKFAKDKIIMRFNNLVVNKVGQAPDEKYRLTIYGPSNCSNYTARWYFEKGGQITSKVSYQAGGNVSETGTGNGPLVKVQLIAPTGKLVGEYIPEMHGKVIDWPSIALTAKDHDNLQMGTDVDFKAFLINLKSTAKSGWDDIREFKVRWQVDPKFGAFNAKETKGLKKFPDIYSNSILKLKTDPVLAGRSFTVTAHLMRQVSLKWIVIAKADLECSLIDPTTPPPAGPAAAPGMQMGLPQVKFVRNAGGNNPFNPQQPVNNKDGQTYSTLTEMIEADGGNNQAAAANQIGTGCTGVATRFSLAGTQQISISMDPATGICNFTGNLTGNMLRFVSPHADAARPGVGNADWVKIYEGGAVWQTEPVAAAVHYIFNPVVIPFNAALRMKANTGLVVDVNVFMQDTGGANGRFLTINSITAVP